MVLEIARNAASCVSPGGTLLFMGGTGARRVAPGLSTAGAMTAAMPALVRNLALELAPVRVNLIAAGFVDTPLSASLLGDQLDARREQLRRTLPIRRVVEPTDVAALAVHLMTNTAVTGATYDIDGGQQLGPGVRSSAAAGVSYEIELDRCPPLVRSTRNRTSVHHWCDDRRNIDHEVVSRKEIS